MQAVRDRRRLGGVRGAACEMDDAREILRLLRAQDSDNGIGRVCPIEDIVRKQLDTHKGRTVFSCNQWLAAIGPEVPDASPPESHTT